MKLKLQMSKKRLVKIKKCFSVKSKYYDNSNKLVVGKMNEETAGVAIEEFVGRIR